MSLDIAAKTKAINNAIASIERQFGKGSILRMDTENIQEIPVTSTGSLTLDRALGVGGFPKGEIIEVYGRIFW